MNGRPDWMLKAACRGMGPSLFFPEVGTDGSISKLAKEVCDGCPVRRECLSECLSLPWELRRFGIWGGTSDNDRRGKGSEAWRMTA